ncbi:MAG: hypothetical protein J7513_06805 [Solirubrobacteraceae bacterium]|nr:hypothetical protein [Solirubrobacteraceae bacterium]
MSAARTPRALRQGYAVLAVAAFGRASYQLATDAGAAPVAYGLSAVAACFYLVASVLLAHADRSPRAREAARAIAAAELTGVLLVGTASLLEPGWFPHDSAWSYFGAGYLLAPLALPIITLRMLRSTL